MTLFIDTSDFNGLRFALINSEKAIEFTTELAFNENYKTAELLEKFLLEQQVELSDLEKIIVCSGPGSFTGIRVGVALSQAMSFALDIPMFTISKEDLPSNLTELLSQELQNNLDLHYGREPNITIK